MEPFFDSLVRLDALGPARVCNRIPVTTTRCQLFDRSIISIDTLKNNLEYRNYLENACGTSSSSMSVTTSARAAEQGKSRRARLAEKLAGRSDTLILLSATPHDGSARALRRSWPFSTPWLSVTRDYTPQDYRDKGLVIRRFKKDISTRLRVTSRNGAPSG